VPAGAIENGPLTARMAVPDAAVPRVERALLLRLCPEDRFRELAAHLRLAHPDADLDVLCQDAATGWVGAEASRLHPVPYGPGRFTVATLGLRRLAALWRRRYDLVVVPYAERSGTGYAQAECAALIIGRGRAWGATAWPGLSGAVWAFSWISFAAARLTRAWSALAGVWMLIAATLRGAGRWRALVARTEER
jgi:hypothetical protein